MKFILLRALIAPLTPTLSPSKGEREEGTRLDQREFFFREKNWFFLVSLGALFFSLAKDFFVVPGPPGAEDIGAHFVFITLILIGLFTTKGWVIETIVPITFLMYCAYIALLFVSLPG